MQVTILVGNPRPSSRTRQVAEALADAIVPYIGAGHRQVIDLAEIAPRLFDWDDGGVTALNAEVARSDLLLIASPTYKAAYTGLLKAFLDRYETDALAGVTAVPVMTGGSAAHSLAPELILRPLLVELGASTPTRGLFVVTSELAQLPATLDDWTAANGAALAAVAAARRTN